MARKFLYVIAGLIVLVIVGKLAYGILQPQLMRIAMVPREAFSDLQPLPADAYDKQAMWIARPDILKDNPALWTPQGVKDAPVPEKAAVFFIHPTSYITTFSNAHWNAPIGEKEADATARRFVTGQASAFNAAGNIWAPRYRQANFGAFLTDGPEGDKALAVAYRDVAQAFAAFLKANPAGPLILAGHSQGSRHLLQLLREQVAGKPVEKRIAAVYAVGWPISVEADLPALGLPACARAAQAHCIVSWQSYAEPADPSAVIETFGKKTGYTGKPRKGTHMLCTNPITGAFNGAAPASANRGTLDSRDAGKPPRLLSGIVPARCDTSGVLMIGEPVDMGPFTLPGNNYHVYDYSLFWANVRNDARQRLAAFLKS
ncbi:MULTISPECIES: DUF3089 domain-containing protein [unclassified Sphingobium]|uniref:DUF3089 domain-containing protein n=1 Tax=unclassified Sphingobium TaxID=2611147 RepID=UPI000D166357|nr:MULTISPECIES: DUF3089 domain-containing protein [unclassified Sphingobium]MBG6117068.1 hypothetical protein [Sphingobium sp. JAI105]PSO11372.1 hypothetical protein C7E20_11855 [Sphingobium sp. AEW4]TWD12724.1 DUF3089 family protein [Sphingobium sp. AEW010]TWD30495.1 DUF3089 family protein [Sphingobium sp. AEW013]TWD30750.1 DUF3089 family protein [Sphingobium sp. AEW001]